MSVTEFIVHAKVSHYQNCHLRDFISDLCVLCEILLHRGKYGLPNLALVNLDHYTSGNTELEM